MTHAQVARVKKRFLDHFCQTGNVTASAELAGCGRRSVYDWLESDAGFAADFREAEKEATERLEQEAWRRATGYDVEDVTEEVLRYRSGAAILNDDGEPKMAVTKRLKRREYSPTLLIFLLKARDPRKYRERVDLTHANPDGTPLEIVINRGPLDRSAETG